ncbi:MAG TPA: thioredoxin family protein, partial [Candidatus Methylacidiphilales bacterium]
PETCLPGKTVVKPSPEPPGTKIYRDDTLLFPQALPGAEATLREEGDGFRLSVSGEGAAALPQTGPIRFLPYEKGIIANGEHQFAIRSASGVELRIRKAVHAEAPAPLSGTVPGLLLAVDAGRGWEIEAQVAPPLPAAPRASGFPWAALGLAFLGGLLLNLMPCVLPVLSLKVLGLVSMPRGEGRRHGLAYTAGVLLSFLALAGLLLALRAAGGRFGWGFQLQSPPFVAFVAALFFAIGLNLVGLFEVGEGLAAKGGSFLAANRKGLAAPFLGGLLAVVVATPCTAPFMGTALGVAFTQPAPVALLVFASLGLGLAAPYLLLSWNPAWLRFVPKSGAWMDWFRRILSVPMFATVAWLLWVYRRETGEAGVLLLALLAVLAAATAFGRWRIGNDAARLAVRTAALVLIGAALSVVLLHKPQPAPSAPAEAADGDWQPYSEALLNDLLDAGRPVFIDFTADWCLPCQVNKRVLDAPETVALFKAKGVVRLLADWTRNDPAITAALARAGRESVPLYLLYDGNPATPPAILPAVLTRQIVADALGKLPAKP